MSIPGTEKATVTVFFGKLGQEKWETKKIDKISINWSKIAKNFRIFSWYPGSSWILINSTTNNSKIIFFFIF